MSRRAPFSEIRTYNFPLQDLGAAAEVFSFRGPLDKDGVILQIGGAVVETFACDNTAAALLVGTAADANLFAQLNIPDATADLVFWSEENDPDAILTRIPKNTLVQFSGQNGVDAGTEAGMVIPILVIEWAP